MTSSVALLSVPQDAMGTFFTAFNSLEKLDLGPVIVHRGTHSVAGDCVAILTVESDGAILLSPDRQVIVESLLSL